MAKMDENFPDLDGYLEGKKRHLVSYAEGARMYQIPYYSFVRLAKEAEANTTLRRTCVRISLKNIWQSIWIRPIGSAWLGGESCGL